MSDFFIVDDIAKISKSTGPTIGASKAPLLSPGQQTIPSAFLSKRSAVMMTVADQFGVIWRIPAHLGRRSRCGITTPQEWCKSSKLKQAGSCSVTDNSQCLQGRHLVDFEFYPADRICEVSRARTPLACTRSSLSRSNTAHSSSYPPCDRRSRTMRRNALAAHDWRQEWDSKMCAKIHQRPLPLDPVEVSQIGDTPMQTTPMRRPQKGAMS
jgi:hypothetical protein